MLAAQQSSEPDRMRGKVALITLHRVPNYGSVLQAFASQMVFEKLGFSVEIIDYCPPNLGDSFNSAVARSSWDNSPLRRFVYRVFWGKQVARSRTVFRSYLTKLNLTSATYSSIEELQAYTTDADIFCVGSDQVWNTTYNSPEHNGGGTSPFLLSFVTSSCHKISLASSIGKNRLSQDERKMFRSGLADFSTVSVREASAVSLLSEIGIPATQVIDPTLMLERDEWAFEHDIGSRRSPYILVYQLNSGPEFDRVVDAVSRRLKLPVVRLIVRQHRFKGSSGKMIQPSVEGWVSAFLHASHVVTDSFHGTAFALNFERELTVVMPPKFSERLFSLLKLIGAEQRIVPLGGTPHLSPMNWSLHASRLREARDEARNWVVSNLEGIRNDSS